MNKLNNYYLEDKCYNFFSRDRYYDEDDRRSPYNDRREMPSRRSPNDWEPNYRSPSSAQRQKYRKDPKGSSRFVFQTFKRLSELFLILTCVAMLVAGLGYTLMSALPVSQLKTMQKYYFVDIVGVSWVFGSILGILTGALYLILYFLMIFNRHGWLRKNHVKSYFFWLITFVLVTPISLYFLFVSSNGSWMEVGGNKIEPKNVEVNNLLTNVMSRVSADSKFIDRLVSIFYNNAIGGIATGLISVGAFIVVAIIGFMYYRSINEVLENSFEYFDNRKRRW